jgi:hypothetical protein
LALCWKAAKISCDTSERVGLRGSRNLHLSILCPVAIGLRSKQQAGNGREAICNIVVVAGSDGFEQPEPRLAHFLEVDPLGPEPLRVPHARSPRR